MYRSLLNQLNEFAQRSREDSGISIEMESDDHDRENDNHVPIVMNGGDNENSEDENDNYDDYDDYDDDDDEIHDDDVVVPAPRRRSSSPTARASWAYTTRTASTRSAATCIAAPVRPPRPPHA